MNFPLRFFNSTVTVSLKRNAHNTGTEYYKIHI